MYYNIWMILWNSICILDADYKMRTIGIIIQIRMSILISKSHYFFEFFFFMCTLLYKYKFTENYYIFWEYHKCILSHLSWIVISIMNLISETHNYIRGRSVHLCYFGSILYNYPKFTLKRTLIVDVIHHLILKWILMEWVIFALFGHWYILSLS